MRILQTVAPAEFGGLEEVVLLLCRGLRDRGHDVAVCTILTGDERSHPFLERLAKEPVSVHSIFLPPRRYLREVSEVREVIRSERPDVVHTHGYRPDVLHRLAAKPFESPLVTTLHGFASGGPKNRFYEWLQIRSIRRFDAVVAVAEDMRRSLVDRGVPRRRLHTIRNGWAPTVDPEPPPRARRILGLGDDRFHIGWVGRLSAEKGPDLLLEAVRDLADPTLTISFIGEGALKPALEKVATRSEADIRFHGMMPEAGRLLGAFDLFVLSSRTEGTPIVLFEAMAAGVPIVATRVGGVPDVLDSDCALLVEPEDPAALVEAIASVRSEPDAAAARAEKAGRRLRNEFSVEPWIRRYEAVYEAISDAYAQ